MKTVKLNDLVDFSNGYAFKSTDYVDSSNTANCRMSNIRPDGSFDIEYNIKYLPDSFADKYSSYLLNDGDIIIAMTDMADDPKILGVPTIVNTKGYRVLMNQRVGKLTLKTDDLNSGYLKYYLMSDYARNYFKSFSGGGVQLNISKKDILNIDIKLCEIEKQKYICEIFEKINSLIIANNEQLSKLDELVKSRFIEMFGDVVDSPKYNGVPLGTICSTLSGGTPTTKVPEYYQGDIPWISTPYLGDNHINGKSAKAYITEKAIKNSATHLIPANTIMFGIRVGVGKSSIIDEPMCANQDIVALMGIDTSRYNLLFIKHVLDGFQCHFDSIKKGATILGITIEDLKKVIIPNVNMEVQEQFATFVEQTDKLKCEVKESLEKLETLKKSLMQKYFG